MFEAQSHTNPEFVPHSLSDAFTTAQLSRTCSERLEDKIVTLAAQLNAANYHMLKLLAEFDDIGGWQGDGIKSFAHWLNWKIGMGYVMAREKVRVARALPDLPLIERAFAKGEVSYSKVRAMTRIATPENERFLLQIARHGTAAHMEQMVKKYAFCRRLEDPDNEAACNREAAVNWYQDDDGMFVIHARLSPEEGAVVIKALELEVSKIKQAQRANSFEDAEREVKVNSKNVSAETFSKPSQFHEDHMSVRASAIAHIAETYLRSIDGTSRNATSNASYSLGDSYQVFLHINAATANSANTDSHVNCYVGDKSQHFLASEVAKRLACDANVSTVLEDDDGNILNIGRKSRTIPRAIRHALRIRDNGCRFPGCHQKHYTDAHHIQHWMNGGETSLDNLITLCRFHHTQLHKGEFTLHRVKNPRLSSKSPVLFRNKMNELIDEALYPQFPGLDASPQAIAASIGQQFTSEPIHKHTAECQWTGETMDYQMAMSELFLRDGAT